jgi:xylose isomerase
MFFLVKLLEEKQYSGPRHFDAHAYRTENEEGVWDFALGCMRTYNMFKEKVRRFQSDVEIQQLLHEINSGDSIYETMLSSGYSANVVRQLKEAIFDPDALGQRGFHYEQLDQLTVEIIMGIR